jgi:hypothetical protein
MVVGHSGVLCRADCAGESQQQLIVLEILYFYKTRIEDMKDSSFIR